MFRVTVSAVNNAEHNPICVSLEKPKSDIEESTHLWEGRIAIIGEKNKTTSSLIRVTKKNPSDK